MQNILQHLFILTSNHRIRKGLLLTPELPGNPEDDAYEWMMVARNTALYTWSPPMLLYFCRVGRTVPPEQGTASTALCHTWGSAGSCLCSSQLKAVQKNRFPSKPMMNTQRQPLVSVHSLARLETVTSVRSKAHPKILHLTDYFLKYFWTKCIPIHVLMEGEALGFD